MTLNTALNRRRSIYTFLTVGAAGVLIFGAFMSGCGASPNDSVVVPSLGFASPTQSVSAATTRLSAVTSGSALTLSELRQRVEDILATPDSSSDPADCFSTITSFNVMINDASCYGPQLVMAGHPGGIPTDTTCSATNPTPLNTYQTKDGCLPSKDLGIWSETETTGEACSAAQLNQLILSTAGAANSGIEIMAGVMCVMEMKSIALPSAGSSVDLTSDLAGVSTAISFDSATLEQESTAHSSGAPIYKLAITATVGTQDVSFTLRNAKDGSSSFGHLFGSVNMGSASGIYGISVTYSDDSAADTVSFEMRSATTPESAGTASLFGADSRYSFTTFLANGNGRVDNSNARSLIASVDRDTGYGTANFAWQAGGSDGNTRVFRATTSSTVAGASGVAYFGFGAAINATSVGEMDGMCCNWAGPGATCNSSGSRNSPSVQAQTFSKTVGGVFAPVVSKIAYAPTNTCNSTAGSFKYGTPTEWNAGTITSTSVTNSLVSEDSLGAVATLSAPTF